MKRSIAVLVAGSAALAACNQGGAGNAAGNAAAGKTAARKHPTWCFFKDSETKGWSASPGRDGTVTVTGKAHVADSRYRAELGQPEVSGTTASLWLVWGENRGYAAADDWWDVSFTIPGSGSVSEVAVMCGKTVAAELKVRR